MSMLPVAFLPALLRASGTGENRKSLSELRNQSNSSTLGGTHGKRTIKRSAAIRPVTASGRRRWVGRSDKRERRLATALLLIRLRGYTPPLPYRSRSRPASEVRGCFLPMRRQSRNLRGEMNSYIRVVRGARRKTDCPRLSCGACSSARLEEWAQPPSRPVLIWSLVNSTPTTAEAESSPRFGVCTRPRRTCTRQSIGCEVFSTASLTGSSGLVQIKVSSDSPGCSSWSSRWPLIDSRSSSLFSVRSGPP